MSIVDFLKNDLAHNRDLLIDAGGDYDTIAGLENIKAALFCRLMTEPGTLIHRPTYGVGLKQYQNAPNSLPVLQKLALRIQEQFQEDPRVESVDGVRTVQDDTNPGQVVLVVRVTIAGYGESAIQSTPFGETNG